MSLRIIGVGANNLKNVNADEVCAQILKETPANSIMTPEFSAELVRCAIELSRVSIGDILKYIQTDMKYDGVTVHPGIIIRFMQNATCHNIMTCVIPADIISHFILPIFTASIIFVIIPLVPPA